MRPERASAPGAKASGRESVGGTAAPESRSGSGDATQLLADNDGAGHRRAVHGAIIRVGTRRIERDRVGLPIAGQDGAAREAGRPLRLDAVRDRSCGRPGPRDGAADGDGVDRGVLTPVVGALEQDVPDDDLAGRTTTPTPATATTTTTAATTPRRGIG